MNKIQYILYTKKEAPKGKDKTQKTGISTTTMIGTAVISILALTGVTVSKKL